MQYYGIKDVIDFVGCSYDKATAIIRELNDLYKEIYPNCVRVQGRIPKWFYEETMGTGKEGKFENEKEV